jgi:hypothetical protein
MKLIHVFIGLFYVIYPIIHVRAFHIPGIQTFMGKGEWLSLVASFGGLLIAWLVFKKDLTGIYLAGMLMGLTVEYITAAYWTYHLNVYIWPGHHIWDRISFFIILGWGFSFSMFVLFSNWIFTSTTHLPLTHPFIIIYDAILAPFWFIPYELLGMQKLHLWEYNVEISQWKTIIPFIKYPLEGVIGALFFGMVLPSFVRYWGNALK